MDQVGRCGVCQRCHGSLVGMRWVLASCNPIIREVAQYSGKTGLVNGTNESDTLKSKMITDARL